MYIVHCTLSMHLWYMYYYSTIFLHVLLHSNMLVGYVPWKVYLGARHTCTHTCTHTWTRTYMDMDISQYDVVCLLLMLLLRV